MSRISENTGKLRAIAASVRNGIELGDTDETLEWCADEIDRLRAENAEVRASYERVERVLKESIEDRAREIAQEMVDAMYPPELVR